VGRSINSRQKGAAAEREFAKLLRGFQHPDGTPVQARRGCQYSGAPASLGQAASEDVVHNIPGITIECKRVEKFSTPMVFSAIDQCRDICGDNAPVVMWRPSRHGWVAIVPVTEFLTLLGLTPINTET
jgi:hypothetical protein